MPLAELLDALGYNQFPQYYLETDGEYSPGVAPLFRSAREAGVDGIYVFQSSPKDRNILPVRPAVYIAEAQTTEQARKIHKALWNLGQAPFLIVVLPNQVRVYTGFDYSREEQEVGLLESGVNLDKTDIRTQLADFCAESINTGNLWRNRSTALKADRRVDKRLLKNLNRLSEYLRKEKKLKPEVAHALIGKYVYIRYLLDRNIVSDQWLEQNHINIDEALGRHGTIEGLRRLVEFLDDQFNGNVFPLDFHISGELTDDVISLIASIFAGDQLLSGDLRQMSLDFQKMYDFAFIPVKTLSSIYEQFLRVEGKGKKIGAFYTPEYLADYLLAEMNAVTPLKEGMKILDPSCGSGIFLVLAYQRLIEMELAGSQTGKLRISKLLKLLSSIYGIEREQDACFVAEFSLILTLLQYANPAELFAEKRLLPRLHNTHIFHYDFFDSSCPLLEPGRKFDWIVGNPPWIQADEQKDHLALQWIDRHKNEQPVSSQNIAEAFSWRTLDLLETNGYIGLILPAASLYNSGSKKYRQYFFHHCEVLRMTDFSNLRYILFERRATAPAITMIYRQASEDQEKPLIDHYGPFLINQTANAESNLWTITMNESEFQTIDPSEVESGDSTPWKIALWGTHRDKRAITRLRRFFPRTFGKLCEENKKRDWYLHEGSQLRFCPDENCSGLEAVPYLAGKKKLNTTIMDISGRLFSVPEEALETIQREECFIRIRGGKKGLLPSEPPHLVMNASWKYVIYSDDYFVIKPRQIGLSVPLEDADYLRALAAFLSSSVVRYYLFFQTPSWGIERDRITLNDVKSIPLPDFTPAQIEELSFLQKELTQLENSQGSLYAQAFLDEQIASLLRIPTSINTLASEFQRVRSKLIGGSIDSFVVRQPATSDFLLYAQEIRDELDAFIATEMYHHRVTITTTRDMNRCTIELVKSENPISPAVEGDPSQEAPLLESLRNLLQKELSQWVYIQRGLRIFEGTKVHLYKAPHLLNWTRTQALNDADDLIAEILAVGMGRR